MNTQKYVKERAFPAFRKNHFKTCDCNRNANLHGHSGSVGLGRLFRVDVDGDDPQGVPSRDLSGGPFAGGAFEGEFPRLHGSARLAFDPDRLLLDRKVRTRRDRFLRDVPEQEIQVLRDDPAKDPNSEAHGGDPVSPVFSRLGNRDVQDLRCDSELVQGLSDFPVAERLDPF